MIDKDMPVVVERVANGYQLRPLYGRDEVVCVSNIFVFQEKGCVSPERDRQAVENTLLGWLDQHFTSGAPNKR